MNIIPGKIEELNIVHKLVDLQIDDDNVFVNLEEYILSFIEFIEKTNFKKSKYPIKLEKKINTTLNSKVMAFLDNNTIININKDEIGFQYKEYKWSIKKEKVNDLDIFVSILIISNNNSIDLNGIYKINIDNNIWVALIVRLAIISEVKNYLKEKNINYIMLEDLNLDCSKVSGFKNK